MNSSDPPSPAVGPLSLTQTLISVALAMLLAATAVVWWRTAPPSTKVLEKRASALTSAALVDETPYATAQRLALLATDEEQPFAQTALRVADHELALAFTAALRDVEAHPPSLSPDALKIQDRLQKSQSLLDADQERVTQLTGDLARAKPSEQDAMQDDLQLAQSQLDLDKDEVEEANQDLVAAGGNPQQRIGVMVQEHDAQVKAREQKAVSTAPQAPALLQHGSLTEFLDWLNQRRNMQQLADAEASAAQKAIMLGEQRAALAATLDNDKGGITELSHHTKAAKAASASSSTVTPAAAAAPLTHENTAAVVSKTKRIAASQKILNLLDRQTADLQQLAGVYQKWMSMAEIRAGAMIHKLMLDAIVVIAIILALLLIDRWIQHLLRGQKIDRRQVETLRTIARISLRLLGVIAVLLIVIGVPGQFGTMIGIVGAGLTVALKDFIVAFFGWLVLMGRNGIRVGDWVEINGVSGEVTELGMFHTVLLETGNWSNSGHPTGRRVTFTNSFAIEKHYFNFSTSGQWLWDELEVVVPAGQDPYPIVEAITRQVVEATAESSRQAQEEWQRAVPSQRAKTFSGAPGVSVKPVVGGVEIAVRYLTRANERFPLRASLFQSAVDLLGKKATA
jgi:small-conductance mechanosensitive channel